MRSHDVQRILISSSGLFMLGAYHNEATKTYAVNKNDVKQHGTSADIIVGHM